MGSKLDARVKVRMARLQCEREERECEREFQLRQELEIRKLEADTAVRMRQLELQAAVVGDSAVTPSGSAAAFDAGSNIQLVPVFLESEVEMFFSAFERIAAALLWPEDVWAILVQCKLVGKAQAACSSLSVEDSLEYDKVKGAILRAYELVPEAYRQGFRGMKKAAGQTYVDFAREKKVLFDRWCRACKADDIASVCELMLVEEFKNCVPERTVVYLNEQRVTTLQQAATLADESALIHRSVLFQRDPPQRDTYRRAPNNDVPCASVPLLGPRIDRACFFCLDPGHMIADCAAWKRKQATTMADEEGLELLAQSDSPHRFGFRKARNRRATQAHSASLPGPKKKKLCFFCLDPGHLEAECVARKEQVATALEKPKDRHPVAMRQSGVVQLSSASVCDSAVGVSVSEAVGVDLAQSDVDLCSVSGVCVVCVPCVAPVLAAGEQYKVCFMGGSVTCRSVCVWSCVCVFLSLPLIVPRCSLSPGAPN
ncbi:uncharacterized protein [Pseudochaenichthys georgianus]|uniref:uncharacterized protein n=1 Tax=Pseudochaenichthys georgianus TaxID=52239 RepID=UPI0039C3EB5F